MHTFVFIHFRDTSLSYWLGLYRDSQGWQRTDNSSYSPAVGMPWQSSPQCVRLIHTGGTWYMQGSQCRERHAFICKYGELLLIHWANS